MEEGFASTGRLFNIQDSISEMKKMQGAFTLLLAIAVWDSSIVVAKYLERHMEHYKGKRCLDLSAGCGLVGESKSCIASVTVL